MTIALLILMSGLLIWLSYLVIHDLVVHKIYRYSFRRFIYRWENVNIKPVKKTEEVLVLNSDFEVVYADSNYILKKDGQYITHVSAKKWNNIADVVHVLLMKYNREFNKKEIKEKQHLAFYGEI